MLECKARSNPVSWTIIVSQKGDFYSVKGAESSAIVYSIVETAKANNLEPYDYLLRVLSLLPGKGKSPSHEELERLMPWHPDVQGREVLRKRKT